MRAVDRQQRAAVLEADSGDGPQRDPAAAPSPGAILAGRVVDADDLAVPLAIVSIEPFTRGGSVGARCDDAGAYELDRRLAPGRQDVRVGDAERVPRGARPAKPGTSARQPRSEAVMEWSIAGPRQSIAVVAVLAEAIFSTLPSQTPATSSAPGSGFALIEHDRGTLSVSVYVTMGLLHIDSDPLPDGYYGLSRVRMNLGLHEYGQTIDLLPTPNPGCPILQTTSPVPVDVDGDGDLDWVWLFMVQRTCPLPNGEVYMNDGTGHLTLLPGAMPVCPSEPLDSFAVDLDGDGDEDLVVRSAGTTTAISPDFTLENDGTGRFTVHVTTIPARPPLTTTAQFLPADIDGDGDPDLVRSTIVGTPSVQILINDGTGTFVLGQNLAPLWSVPFLDSADVDGDGCADLVISERVGPSRIELWLGSPSGTMIPATSSLPIPPNTWYGLASVGDFDGDGDPDLVVPERMTRTGPYRLLRYWRNVGAGRFVDVTDGLMPVLGTELPRSLWSRYYDVFSTRAADQDGDGDLDLLVVPGNGPAAPPLGGYTLWNLTRHLTTTGDPAIGQPDYAVTMFADFGHVVVPVVSLGRTIVDLGQLGTLQIAAGSGVALPPLLTDVSRRAIWTLPVPNDPRLTGVDLHWQGVEVDPARGSVHLTNGVRDTVR